MSTESPVSPAQPLPTSRWLQLLFGLVCMMAISSPQYVWTLFTGPFSTHLGATLAQVQVTISILIVLQTFLSPFQGLSHACPDVALGLSPDLAQSAKIGASSNSYPKEPPLSLQKGGERWLISQGFPKVEKLRFTFPILFERCPLPPPVASRTP